MPTTTHAVGHSLSAEAARRWAECKAALLRDHGVAPAEHLAAAAGGSTGEGLTPRVDGWRAAGWIFAVNDGERLVYPLFQIKDGRPHPVVRAVLRHLRPKLTDWQIFAWFTAPDGWSCRGRAPKDLFDEDPEAVVEAARHAVAETWD